MDGFQTLATRLDERGVLYLTLDLPDRRNALSALMIDELTGFAHSLEPGGSIRAVVLAGAGKIFCAGGDLDWMKAQIEADRETRMIEARKLAMMLKALNEMPVPLIGAIHGGAFGGAVGLACVCDIAFARRDAKFGLTETRLGLIPATIGPYVVARLGEGMARRVFMSGGVFDADQARTLGLIAETCEDAEGLDATTEAALVPYLHAAPEAVAHAKALARALGPRIDDALIDETIRQLADIWEGEEAAHGIQSFLTKTAPRWA